MANRLQRSHWNECFFWHFTSNDQSFEFGPRGVGGDPQHRGIGRSRTWVMPSTPSRYRSGLPDSEFVRRPRPGTGVDHRGAGRARYRFPLCSCRALSLARSCLPSKIPDATPEIIGAMRWVTNRRFWHEFDITGSADLFLGSLSRCKTICVRLSRYQPDRDRQRSMSA